MPAPADPTTQGLALLGGSPIIRSIQMGSVSEVRSFIGNRGGFAANTSITIRLSSGTVLFSMATLGFLNMLRRDSRHHFQTKES
jgi:hypothetical protein